MSNKHIAFWFGTEAELLKTFPVILSLREKWKSPYIIATGQNDIKKSTIARTYNIFADITLNQFNGRKKPLYIILWFFSTFFFKFFKARKFIKQKNIQYVVVHGDTLSTLMGAIFARLSGAKVFHLEGGLRSFKRFKPFPEEIDRFIVWHLSSVHFCQNEQAMKNVKNHKGEKIFTEGNVVYDVVDMFSQEAQSEIVKTLKKQFWVVTFHRAESLYIQKNLDILLETLFLAAEKWQVLFVMFEATREVLQDKWDILEKIKNHKNIITTPRLPYEDFCYVMKVAEYIITDWGSNQEELAHLGTPTMVMRNETERTDGLDTNIILSHFDINTIQRFLEDYKKYNFKWIEQGSPTQIVVDYILKITQ